MPAQRILPGHPNRNTDGAPMTLADAIAASPVGWAITRREPDTKNPDPRTLVVTSATDTNEWYVYEVVFLVGQTNVQGWPMSDYRDAEAFTAYRLWVPRAEVWWPVTSTNMEIEDDAGQVTAIPF